MLFYTHRNFMACLLLTSLSMLLTGCHPPSEKSSEVREQASKNKQLHFAVIPKGENHIFWQSVRVGAEQAGVECDVRVTFKGPAKEDDRSAQISVMESFLNAGVDGICLAPLDADALVRPVEEATRAGVPVVIFDSGLSGAKDAYAAFVATDNFRGGQLAADAMAASLGDDGGRVICLRYIQGSDSTLRREDGFLDGIAKYPNIKVISSDQYSGATTESAMDKAQSLLNRFGDDVDGVFTACEPNAEGMLRALRDRGLAGNVKLVAFDTSDSLREAMSKGDVSAIVLQDPVRMGYLAVKTLAASVRGENVETFVDTGIFVATKETQDDETIARLLNPPQ